MTLQEQAQLACAYQCAKAAHEAARAMLPLIPGRLAEVQPAYQYVAGLREAERAAWDSYLSACQLDVAEFQSAYEAQQHTTRHLQAA